MRDEHVGRIFTHNELYFASPAKFNDPFDCKISVSIEGCTDEDMKRGHRRLNDFLPRYKGYEWGPASKDKTLQQKISVAESVDEGYAKLGMLCLSKPNDDILLWSHYADGHRGIALEFDEEGLRKWIDDLNGWLKPIDYTDNKPTIKEFNEAMWGLRWSLLKLFLLRKAAHWKYEGEYRAIMFPKERPKKYEDENQITYGYYKFPSEILTGIILGCQISDADKCSVEAWQREYQPQAKIYRAVKDENSFSLKIDGLS